MFFFFFFFALLGQAVAGVRYEFFFLVASPKNKVSIIILS